MKFKTTLLCSLLAGLAVFPDFSRAADWPRYRGPDFNGISKESNIQLNWESEPKRLWKGKIGSGYSSVTVAKGKLYTMGLLGKTETTWCFDAMTGKEIWKHEEPARYKAMFYDGGTSATPTVDGDRVYVLGQMGKFLCLDAATGKPVWSLALKEEYGMKIGYWGLTGAPFIHGDNVVINAGTHGMAFNKKTGKLVWNSGKGKSGYASPVPFKHGTRELLAIFAAKALHAIDPASGKEVWKFPWKTNYDVHAADPVLLGGKRMLISSGYNTGAAVIDYSTGKPEKVWQNKSLRTQFHPGVLVDGYIYGIDGDTAGKAKLNCIDPKTGKLMWSQSGINSGSVMAAGGKLIVLTEQGELITANASPKKFDPIARAQILAKKCWTIPTLANGILYCRNQRGDLVALDLR